MTKAVRKAAGFVIYRKNRDEIIEYLLMQASYANYHWTPPKGTNTKYFYGAIYIFVDFILIAGHLEKDESNMDAAIRETEEEAGIKVKDLNVDLSFEKVLTVRTKRFFVKNKLYSRVLIF